MTQSKQETLQLLKACKQAIRDMKHDGKIIFPALRWQANQLNKKGK